MKNLAISPYFKKQFEKLPKNEKEKVSSAIKEFIRSLAEQKFSSGLGFKKISNNQYEIRADIRVRIAMRLEEDTFTCVLLGNHDEIKRYIKEYGNG